MSRTSLVTFSLTKPRESLRPVRGSRMACSPCRAGMAEMMHRIPISLSPSGISSIRARRAGSLLAMSSRCAATKEPWRSENRRESSSQRPVTSSVSQTVLFSVVHAATALGFA